MESLSKEEIIDGLNLADSLYRVLVKEQSRIEKEIEKCNEIRDKLSKLLNEKSK